PLQRRLLPRLQRPVLVEQALQPAHQHQRAPLLGRQRPRQRQLLPEVLAGEAQQQEARHDRRLEPQQAQPAPLAHAPLDVARRRPRSDPRLGAPPPPGGPPPPAAAGRAPPPPGGGPPAAATATATPAACPPPGAGPARGPADAPPGGLPPAGSPLRPAPASG